MSQASAICELEPDAAITASAAEAARPAEAKAVEVDETQGTAGSLEILTIIQAEPPRPEDRRRSALSLLAAAAAHAGLLGWLAASPQPETLGFDGIELDSVSIEIIPATALAARETAESQATSGQPALPVDHVDGAAVEREANTASAESVARPLAEPAKPEPDRPDIVIADWKAKLEPTPPDAVTIVIAPKPAKPSPEPSEQPEPEKPLTTASRTDAPAQASTEAAAASLGGAAAMSPERPAISETGRAQAASGTAMTSYTRDLIGALAELQRQVQRSAARQSGIGRGKVVLRLTIGHDGGAQDIAVATSSGQSRLDTRALADVQAFRFPPPPQAASDKQRTYLLPITYR